MEAAERRLRGVRRKRWSVGRSVGQSVVLLGATEAGPRLRGLEVELMVFTFLAGFFKTSNRTLVVTATLTPTLSQQKDELDETAGAELPGCPQGGAASPATTQGDSQTRPRGPGSLHPGTWQPAGA